jgi:hypothetical protein
MGSVSTTGCWLTVSVTGPEWRAEDATERSFPWRTCPHPSQGLGQLEWKVWASVARVGFQSAGETFPGGHRPL